MLRFAEVDIWSAGIIMYALLTGFLPFDDDDEEVMKRKVMSLDYEIPPGVSDGLCSPSVVYCMDILSHS